MQLSRRNFLGAGAMLGASLTAGGASSLFGEEANKTYRTKLYKGIGCRFPNVRETMEEAAQAGYDGVEMWDWDIDVSQAREARAIAEANGLRIHSLARGWTNLNNPETYKEDVESVKKTLKIAREFGADAILWVPCRVDAPDIAPADFRIEFDPATAKVSKVVEGDNSPFVGYIRRQNQANDITAKALEELIPVAAYEGVTIALENVWNQLWVTPAFAAAYTKQFDNLWVKYYFDLGNHAKYASTEDWLRAFGANAISKLHFKDFAVDPTQPMGGNFVPLGYGTIDWVSVRKTLDEINYNGWVTLEDVPHYSVEEHNRICDAFFNGTLTKQFAESVR